jgi:hypothetical protein
LAVSPDAVVETDVPTIARLPPRVRVVCVLAVRFFPTACALRSKSIGGKT